MKSTKQEREGVTLTNTGRTKGLIIGLVVLSASNLAGDSAWAQEADDAAALVNAAQNPLASAISAPLQWNSNFNMGMEERTQNVILFQPVVPFSLGDKLALITRHILPFVNQPALSGDGPASGPGLLPPGRPPELDLDRKTGLGDYSLTLWLSPAPSGNFSWGLGPTILFPTASKPAFGADKWGIGPSAVVVWTPGSWVTALVLSNTWSFAGNEERDDLNQLFAQVVANYNLSGGWYLTSAPVITANWNGDEGNKWTVPIGGGAGRVFRIGSIGSDIRAQVFGYLENAEFGPGWTLQLQWKLMFLK